MPRKSTPHLESAFAHLAQTFADALIAEVVRARLGELEDGAPSLERAPAAKSGRTARTSSVARRARALDRIETLLKTRHEGLRAEQIRSSLGVDKQLFTHAVSDGLEVGRLRKEGERRATTYFAV